jgi:hypothetical protein
MIPPGFTLILSEGIYAIGETTLIRGEIPRLCRGGGRSLTVPGVT